MYFLLKHGDIPAITILVYQRVIASFLFVTQKNADTDDLFQDFLAVGPNSIRCQAVKPGGIVGKRLAIGARYPFVFEKFCSWWTSTDIRIYIYIYIYIHVFMICMIFM